MNSKKLSISLERDLLQAIDRARKQTGESRSGLIARLLLAWMELKNCRGDSGERRRKND
jgi:metal-responsive CopG/Arc/MetJ family transcriptional regulator